VSAQTAPSTTARAETLLALAVLAVVVILITA